LDSYKSWFENNIKVRRLSAQLLKWKSGVAVVYKTSSLFVHKGNNVYNTYQTTFSGGVIDPSRFNF